MSRMLIELWIIDAKPLYVHAVAGNVQPATFPGRAECLSLQAPSSHCYEVCRAYQPNVRFSITRPSNIIIRQVRLKAATS